jgi:hypothetical protein
MMEISSAGLASLLKEAMMPQPVPAAKADPVRTALVRELVQPPAPSLFAQRTAPTLIAMPATPIAVKSQQIASAGIVEAYMAQLDIGEDAVVASVAARKAAHDAEAQRGALPPSVMANDNASVRSSGVSLLSFIPPQVPAPRSTVAPQTSAGRRTPANQAHAVALNPERLLVKIGFVSITAGLLAMMTVGFVLLLLR